MKLNLKTIIIIVVAIVILVVIFSFTSPKESKEDLAKKNEINNMFAVWMDVSGPGDKVTLTSNEAPIKKDLFEKLNIQEVTTLKTYSLALRDMLKSKSTPFSATFLNAIAYLTTNFRTAKDIVGKTNARNVFDGFGLGSVPASRSEMS